jgi:hypothetical protein
MLRQRISELRPVHYNWWGFLSIAVNLSLFRLVLLFPGFFGLTEVPGADMAPEMPIALKIINYPVLWPLTYEWNAVGRSYRAWSQTARSIHDACLGTYVLVGLLCWWYLIGNLIALLAKRLRPKTREIRPDVS